MERDLPGRKSAETETTREEIRTRKKQRGRAGGRNDSTRSLGEIVVCRNARKRFPLPFKGGQPRGQTCVA